MKVVQAYAANSSRDDEEIEQLYEEVELAMRKVQTQYTLVMGDLNAKVGEKQVGEQAIGNYGIDSRNTR